MCATSEAQTIYPSKDGTLVDGGSYGIFDGSADHADWYFNESSYEGSITLTQDVEYRVVWEYDVSGVTLEPPVSATLTFEIRGASLFPLSDVAVHVYSYPADLLETLDDFHAGPTELQGVAIVEPYQESRVYTVNVGGPVNEALTSGGDAVAFRFQVDPNTTQDANQAFMDVLEAEPTTKPALTVTDFVPPPGDFNGDGYVDLSDYVKLNECLKGPGLTVEQACATFDFDDDSDVDLQDYAAFTAFFTGP
ncbi:MAG: hypothetical protein JSU63_02320 [Phycisphaerales bacterium]|nr:MAG: hypothetical protein JSU63_02320 [Phycisphaerales bacterium]